MSKLHDNARLLVKTILDAEPPPYTATAPILAYSTRSLGNAFSDLEEQLIPEIIKAKCGKAYEKTSAAFAIGFTEPCRCWLFSRTTNHPFNT